MKKTVNKRLDIRWPDNDLISEFDTSEPDKFINNKKPTSPNQLIQKRFDKLNLILVCLIFLALALVILFSK